MLDAAIAAIDAHTESLRADGSIPGLVLGVTGRDGILVDRQYGFAEVASGRPVEPETLFEIGSIGKTFAAIIVMQLVEEGRVQLDDPVVRHLPWFKVPRTGDRITIRHLLSHTAGITAGIDGSPEPTFNVWRLRDLPPGSAPGRRFHYSNVGFKAIGLMIEAIEGAPYPDVVRRRVLDPLGMSSSEPAITNDIRSRLAVGYEPARDDAPWTEGDPVLPATWLETDSADGAIASTAADMAVFAQMLLREGRGRDGPLISASSFAEMTRPVPAIGSYGYALGIYGRDLGGGAMIGHTGGMVGYIAGLWCEPASGIGAVVLQSGPGHRPNRLAWQAIKVIAAARAGRDPAVEFATIRAAFAAADAVEEAEASLEGAEPPVPPDPDADPALKAIVGHYRSYDPWATNFRVVLRGAEPWLLFTAEPDGFEGEQRLHAMAGGWFRVGDDRLGPERMRFDTVIDGHTRRAWLSGWDYYRIGDP
jgi:CubicO group peptidase (beta-lactamase class C family)